MVLWGRKRIKNRTVFVKEKKTHKKELAEAQFGLVLNWASVTQGGSKTMMIKEINVRIQKSRNIYSVSYIKVKEQFFFHLAV